MWYLAGLINGNENGPPTSHNTGLTLTGGASNWHCQLLLSFSSSLWPSLFVPDNLACVPRAECPSGGTSFHPRPAHPPRCLTPSHQVSPA